MGYCSSAKYTGLGQKQFSFLFIAFIASLLLSPIFFLLPWIRVDVHFQEQPVRDSIGFYFWENLRTNFCYRLLIAGQDEATIQTLQVLGITGFIAQIAVWVLFFKVHRQSILRGLRLPLLILAAACSIGLVLAELRMGGGEGGFECIFMPQSITQREVGIFWPSLLLILLGLGLPMLGIVLPLCQRKGQQS